MRLEDFDAFGNTCVHLAASGGNLLVFETLMMYGIDITKRNARNHQIIDLATNREIIKLIELHRDTLECKGCGVVFTELGDNYKKLWC